MPVGVDQRRRAPPLSPSSSHGAGRGTRDLVLLTLGTGVGGGVRARRPALPRLGRGRAHGDRRGRRAVPGRLHRAAATSSRTAPGSAADRLARASCSGPTRDAHDLVEQRHPALDEIGRHLGAAIASLVNLFDPGRRRHRRRLRRRGGRAAARAGARGRAARGARRRPATVRLAVAELGPRPRGDRRRRSSRSRRSGRSAAVPLAVCATPIGNLDDVTLRVLDELREADVVLCEDTRHTAAPARPPRDRGAARSPTTSTTRPSGSREVLPRLVAGERIALVSDAGLPGHLRSGRRGSCGRRSPRACR